eukprot:m.153873 g.153873  ORF g.153873 m.153873 type:complete len:638 (+) comp30857_c1_seq3:113-2026(+)
MMLQLQFVMTVIAAAVTAASGSNNNKWDVVVYGSTPGGIAAATAAGRLGLSVALYEPLKMIGGMGAAGNLALHDGGAISGLGTEFSMLAAKWYNISSPVLQPESFVSVAVYHQMLASANVTEIKLDCRVTGATSETMAGVSKVKSINVFCENDPVTATVFIDASYDGDIMTAVGDVKYTAGRESNTTYNESLAGARVPGFVGVSGPQHVDALKPDGTILKYVQNISTLASPGSADDALMAFQHRLCVSGADDRVPWPKPPGYDADDFLLLQRSLDATGGDVFSNMPPSAMKGPGAAKHKYTLCCGISVDASDQPNLNAGWANATWERKQEIIAEHIYFEMGSLYYLANDPKVPQTKRDQYSKYGLCADEFQEYGNIPPQLYIRISNRLVGEFVITQNNIMNPAFKNDSVAVGSWSFDEHMTGKYAVPVGNGKFEVQLEGNFWPKCGTYGIPYSALTPQRGQGANLLVPVCLSASAVAYSTTRIEGMFMSTGTAAGVAAKQIVDGEVATVQDVNVSKVQEILQSVFKQTTGGSPAPPPPSGPVPTYYNVTQAGSTDWNGQYVHNGTKFGRTPYYVSLAQPTHSLYKDKDAWRLAILGTEIEYVAVEGDGSLPPLTGWSVSNGTAPPPVLIAGPTSPTL